jgi:high-affinity iron transporter
LGVALTATSGLPRRGSFIWGGFFAGVAGSVVIAVLASAITDAFEGVGQEILNGSILISAGILVGFTVLWMQSHGKNFSNRIKTLAEEVKNRRTVMLTPAIIIALSVLREGSEIVLFTAGIVASGQTFFQTSLGMIFGFAAGFFVGAVIYFGLLKLPVKYFFKTTGIILVLLSAGMLAQGFSFLSLAGIVPEVSSQIWDSSWLLSENSGVGQILKSLAGYTDRPSGIYAIIYLLTILVIASVLYKPFNRDKKTRNPLTQKTGKVTAVIFLLAFVGFFNRPVDAQKLYSPHVNPGEMEIELRTEYGMNDWVNFENSQKFKPAVGVAVNGFWFTEVYGIFEVAPAGPFTMEGLEWANKFMLAEPGEWFIDTGIYLAYELTFSEAIADETEFKILLEKETGVFTHRLNPVFKLEFGGSEKSSYAAKIGAGSHWRFNKAFEPGFELYADFGEFNQVGLVVGPVIYGKLGMFKYDLGYLFDVTSSSNRTDYFKFNIEYEIYF